MSEEVSGAPLYRLVEDESMRELLVVNDIDGFFLEPDRGNSDLIIMAGAKSFVGWEPGLFDDVELVILDNHGESMGRYFIGRVEFLGARESERLTGTYDLTVSFFGFAAHYPKAAELWRRWASASGMPIALGEWAKYPPDFHASWLHVVQEAWFESGHDAARYSLDAEYEIDGSLIANVDSFYCAIGEAINGPGGYFGSNPAALNDCFRPFKPFRLLWREFEASAKRIGDEEMTYIVETLEEGAVQIVHL